MEYAGFKPGISAPEMWHAELLGWSDFFFFFIRQKTAINYVKFMYNFRSPNLNFRRAPALARQSFHFQKIPGGLNINIFL